MRSRSCRLRFGLVADADCWPTTKEPSCRRTIASQGALFLPSAGATKEVADGRFCCLVACEFAAADFGDEFVGEPAAAMPKSEINLT